MVVKEIERIKNSQKWLTIATVRYRNYEVTILDNKQNVYKNVSCNILYISPFQDYKANKNHIIVMSETADQEKISDN